VVLEKDGEISWADLVKNEEVLLGVKEERNILATVKPRKTPGLVAACLGSSL
jgi:hypothetical protein